MVILLMICAGFLGIMILIATLNAVLGPSLRNAPAQSNTPLVSILVPARNEELTLEECVKGLLAQEYPIFEVIVLDDESTDRTSDILQKLSGTSSKLRIIHGQSIPEGWTGKAWACHQLQLQAAGEILLFTDADNSYHPRCLVDTISWMEKYSLGFLSAFPQQFTRTFPEKLIIPVVDLFVYAFLPLWLTLKSPAPSLAAANGQWLVFRKETYKKLGGHESLKTSVVEDVEFSRVVKQFGIPMLTLAGTGRVFGRMYGSWKEVWTGFSKNLFIVGGGNPVGFVVLSLFLLLLFTSPYILLFIPSYFKWGIFLILMNMVLRTMVAIAFRHPLFESVILHPIGILATLSIGFNSMLWHLRGEVKWKDRNFRVEKAGNRRHV